MKSKLNQHLTADYADRMLPTKIKTLPLITLISRIFTDRTVEFIFSMIQDELSPVFNTKEEKT